MKQAFYALLPARGEVPDADARITFDRKIIPGIGQRLFSKWHTFFKGVCQKTKSALCIHPINNLLRPQGATINHFLYVIGQIVMIPASYLQAQKNQKAIVNSFIL